MKTKNRKRIGAVPISLVAALALAAFLSAGLLLAPNGAPTAEAQDADCDVTVSADGTTVTLPTPDAAGSHCSAQGDTATVEFMGDALATEDATLSLLIADTAGPITAYPNGTVWNTALDPDELADGTGGNATRATSMRYRFQSVTIPKAKANATTGIVEGQKVSVMAKGNVHVSTGSVSVTSPIGSIPSGNAATGAREVASGSDEVMITFLGNPAIGKESANDRNKIVDDFMQCTLGPLTTDEASTDPDGNMANCAPLGDDTADTADMAESRSKLEADGGVTQWAAVDVSVLDGKKAEIELTGMDATVGGAVAIRATIKDAKGQVLEGVEVTFTATSVPAGIENRTRSYDSGVPGTADHVIQGLPTDKPYRVTVVVTAGENNPLTVGTIVIARAGDLDTITAEACAKVMGDETDTKMDGCMTGYNPKMIYGREDMFSIYAKAADSRGTKVTPSPFMVKPATAATWWDALDCMEMNDAVMPMGDEPAVGSDDTSPYCKMYAGLSAEAKPVVMRAFGKAYGDATDAFNITATGTSVPENGMVMLTVEDDAPGAKYLLDVVGTAGPSKKRITKSDQVQVIVSGKVHEYRVEPEQRFIMPRRSAEFTVKALDDNGNPPDFDTDKNMVKVIADYGIVRGSGYDRSSSELTLSLTTGEGKFTFVMPRNAVDGEEFVVLIGEGKMQVEAMVTVGEAPPEMMAPGMPMSVMAMAMGHDMIKVTWDAPADNGGSAITGYMVQRGTMGADEMMTWMDVDPAHMGMDMMYTDMGLMADTKYYYRVAAMNAEGMGEYSDGMATATTLMTETNQSPMAEGTIPAVTLTAGEMSDAMDVSMYFSDADMDTLVYTAMSNMEMYATVMVDGSMVTITGVAAGMATITVTATDPDGASVTQDIMVTVMAADMTLTAPTGVDASVLLNSISVTWTPGSAQNASAIKVVLFNEAVTAVEMIHTINPAAGDIGAHTFQNVPAGTYKVAVASYRAGEAHVLSNFVTVTVQ